MKRVYNKEELLNIIDNISIERHGNQVVTKFSNRVLKVVDVSNLYEIFDIRDFFKKSIRKIEQNFDINSYTISIKGGVQLLELFSDKININGVDFYKSFYILNSSDRTKRLSFNIGLKSLDNTYVVDLKNSFTKKHTNGVTKAAELASISLDGDSFNEQIKSIESLVNHSISFSKMREIILGKENISKSSHKKFDIFKSNILKYDLNLNESQLKLVSKSSENISIIPNNLDFDIDAFKAFFMYMNIFSKKDPNIVRRETTKILEMTKWAVRKSALTKLGIL